MVEVSDVSEGGAKLPPIDDDLPEVKAAEKIMDRYRNALAELAK